MTHACMSVCAQFWELLGRIALFCFAFFLIKFLKILMKEEKTCRDPSLWPPLPWKFLWSSQLESLSLLTQGSPVLHFPEDTGLCSINMHVAIFSTDLISALAMSWPPNTMVSSTIGPPSPLDWWLGKMFSFDFFYIRFSILLIYSF